MSESQSIQLSQTTASAAVPDETVMASEATSTIVVATSEPAVPQETKSEPVVSADKPPESWLWLNKLDQRFVTVFAAVFLTLVGYHWATLGGWGMQPIELERLPSRQYDFRIDINSASWVEWTQIEGIGEATANKIVADRDSNGPFRTIDDLLRVKGIGPKKLETMRPFLREPNEPATSANPHP